MFPRWAGAAHRGESSCAGERSTDGDASRSLPGGGLYDAAATKWKRSVRDSTVRQFGDEINFEWATIAVNGQPGHLRTHWHAPADCCNSNSGNRNVIHR